MRVCELMELVTETTMLQLWNEDGDVISVYDGKNSINPKYNELEVESISICNGHLVLGVAMPTWRLKGSYTVEIEVLVRALTEDDAFDIADRFDPDFPHSTPDVDLDDTYTNSIEWEDAEME